MVEIEDLKEAFEPGDVVRHYFDALFGYLSVPSPARARFERLCAASNALGLPPTRPGRWRPSSPSSRFPPGSWSSSPLGERRGEPARLRPPVPGGPELGDLLAPPRPLQRLLEKLQPSGAKDLVDVEVFLHATGARRPAARYGQAGTKAREPKNGDSKKVTKEAQAKSRRKR